MASKLLMPSWPVNMWLTPMRTRTIATNTATQSEGSNLPIRLIKKRLRLLVIADLVISKPVIIMKVATPMKVR